MPSWLGQENPNLTSLYTGACGSPESRPRDLRVPRNTLWMLLLYSNDKMVLQIGPQLPATTTSFYILLKAITALSIDLV